MPSQPGTVLAWFSRDGGGDQYAWVQEDSTSLRWTGVYTAAGTDTVYGLTRPISGGTSAGSEASPVNSTLRLAMHVTPANGADQLMYYGSATPGTGTGGVDESSHYDRMTIGGRHANGQAPDLFMNGSVAELHFYNGTLTAQDYTDIANGTKKPKEVAGWVDGWQLKTASDLTSMTGTRTLTVVGTGLTTSGVAHPVNYAAPDTTAPTLTSPTGAQTGATSGSASVTVSEACTVWCLTLPASAGAPDAPTIKTSGTSQAAGAAGLVTFPSRTGLTTGTAHKNYFVATDAANNTSPVASSGSFTPSATNSPPTFPGNIANITGTGGAAISTVNVASQFADTDALTYSASPAGTAWPSGLTINPTTGGISGTVATGTTNGLKVRATDTASQTVDSNAFSVTMSAPAASGTFVTYKLGNNTGTGTWPAGTAVKWEWKQRAGGIGTAVTSTTNGAGTVASDGTVTLTGLPAGAGDVLLTATASGGVFWQPGTVS